MKPVLSKELYKRFANSSGEADQQPMIQTRSGLLAPTKNRTKETEQKVEPNDVVRRYFKTINNMRMSLRDA